MKDGKCCDDDGVSAEHFKHGPLILFIKLASLFNSMLTHGYVTGHPKKSVHESEGKTALKNENDLAES